MTVLVVAEDDFPLPLTRSLVLLNDLKVYPFILRDDLHLAEAVIRIEVVYVIVTAHYAFYSSFSLTLQGLRVTLTKHSHNGESQCQFKLPEAKSSFKR